FSCANGKSLFRAGALAGGIEHLRTSESQLHWSLQHFGGRCGEQRVTPLKCLGPERASYKRTNDAHIFQWQTECVANDSLQLFDPASALVNKQPVRCLPFGRS